MTYFGLALHKTCVCNVLATFVWHSSAPGALSDALAGVCLQVDQQGFERELDSQKKRSREAYKGVDLTAGRALGDLAGQLGTSDFIGYKHDSLRADASVLAILKEGKTVESASAGEGVEVVLDRTPFYAESGGQVLPDKSCVSYVCFGQACPCMHAMHIELPGT